MEDRAYPPEEYPAMALGSHGGQKLAQRETIKGSLERNLAYFKRSIKETEEALQLLERNPDIERLMDLLGNRIR